MAKRKRRRTAAGILFGVSAVAVGALFCTLTASPPGAAPDSRARLVLTISLAVLLCFAVLVVLAWSRKREQVQIWQQVVSTLNKPPEPDGLSTDPTPGDPHLGQMSQEELQAFAIRLYRVLGYRLFRQEAWENENLLFIMTNPQGEVELLCCLQRKEPVGLGEVTALYAHIADCGAARCFLWAPGGFKKEAAFWARRKPILLAGAREIGRLVQGTQAAVEGKEID
jgi:hypothetical protein